MLAEFELMLDISLNGKRIEKRHIILSKLTGFSFDSKKKLHIPVTVLSFHMKNVAEILDSLQSKQNHH